MNGDAEEGWEDCDNIELKGRDLTQFRGLAARPNYLAQDRVDIMYTTKEVCRQMSKPTVGAWKALKKLLQTQKPGPPKSLEIIKKKYYRLRNQDLPKSLESINVEFCWCPDGFGSRRPARKRTPKA